MPDSTAQRRYLATTDRRSRAAVLVARAAVATDDPVLVVDAIDLITGAISPWPVWTPSPPGTSSLCCGVVVTMTNDEVAWLKGVAKLLKLGRIRHDMTQAELATWKGLTRNKISAIERSAQLVKLYEINSVVAAVGVEWADIVDGAP